MDITKLIRDANKIYACLKELPDNSLVALKKLRIYIPTRFEERELANIAEEVYICGIYAIVNEEGFYAVSSVNAMVRIQPSNITKVKIDNDDYYEFTFNAGSVVIPNLNLVKNDTLTYYIFDEFFSKSRIPWYIGYDDLGNIFSTAKKYAGARAGDDEVVIDLIASIIARDPKNRYQMYRHVIKDKSTLLNNPPVYVPLNAIQYTATNTTTKLAGSYMSEGVVSALVNPSERTERIETLLTR